MSQPFLYNRRVSFADTDMAGILHFSNYYRYMEETEHAFWRSFGLSVNTKDGDRPITWPRVASSCEYFAPAKFEEDLVIALTVANVGDRSVTFEFEFRRESTRIAIGRTTAVCCTIEDDEFKPVSIPPGLREKLDAACGAPSAD